MPGAGQGRIAAIADVAEFACRTEPEMDALAGEWMAIRHRAMREIVARVRDEGRLRPGWTIDDATGFVWTPLSPAHIGCSSTKGVGRHVGGRLVRGSCCSARSSLMGPTISTPDQQNDAPISP